MPFKPFTIVKFIHNKQYAKKYKMPFNEKDSYIYLGELWQAKGHCIILDMNGKIFPFYHTDNFRIATEEEI